MKKIAVVTGGSSGIGLSIVKEFQSQGIIAISWDLESASDSIPYIYCDVSSENKVHKAYEETLKSYGVPNILVNNCGLQYMAPVDEFPLEKWNLLISVMLTGTFICSKTLIPGMKEIGWGRIVNVSSIHGKIASPYKSAYVSAKHGVLRLSKVMAQELSQFNITVNSICPGFVDTPLMRKQVSDQAKLHQISEEEVISSIMLQPACVKEFTTTEQVASMVSFFISDAASTITGEAFNMSGGWGMGL